jgi:hypothetical protein
MTFENENSSDLANEVSGLLNDTHRRAELSAQGRLRAAEFDWSVVAERIVDVYESIRVPGVKVEPDLTGQMIGRLGRGRITPEARSD